MEPNTLDLLDFDLYQREAGQTAVYPDRYNNLTYPALGLAGEAGEVCEKIKKVIRDKGGVVDDETKRELIKELGDVLWYISALADELDVFLSTVADVNLAKLRSRQTRDKIQGSGDNR